MLSFVFLFVFRFFMFFDAAPVILQGSPLPSLNGSHLATKEFAHEGFPSESGGQDMSAFCCRLDGSFLLVSLLQSS